MKKGIAFWLAVIMTMVTILIGYETYYLIVRTDFIDIQVIFAVLTVIFTYISYLLWKQKEMYDKKKR